MSTLLENVVTEDEVPDKSQRMKKLFDLIEKGLTQTSVTSVSSSDATTIRPKKGDNKRFKEKGIEEWYDRKLESDKINIPDWGKETHRIHYRSMESSALQCGRFIRAKLR